MVYINVSEEDVYIVKSFVGFFGCVIRNKFIEEVKINCLEIKKCYNCLIFCNLKEIFYCIF